MSEFFSSLLDSQRAGPIEQAVIADIVRSTRMIELTTSIQDGIVNPEIDDMTAFHEHNFVFVARPQFGQSEIDRESTRPIIAFVTSTKYGHATLGAVKLYTDRISPIGSCPYDSSLPRSLFTITETRAEETTGRIKIAGIIHANRLIANDLNAPNTSLGRLCRFSIAQSIVNARPTPTINFDERAARMEALAKKIGLIGLI